MATLSAEEHRHLMMEAAPAWVPSEAGDTITGTVVGILRRELDNQFGHQVYPAVILDTAEDPEAGFDYVGLHVIGAVLTKRMGEIKPVIGDRLICRFNGKKVSGSSNQTYADITVIDAKTVGAPAAAWSWDSPAPVSPAPVMPTAATATKVRTNANYGKSTPQADPPADEIPF